MINYRFSDDTFAGSEILHLTDYDTKIDERSGQSGMSNLVDMVARKPD
ncbi:hypothetical protein [Falsiphaeobacter marinintestinus]|nr:hypothetical protein [Phaeobacter marinintestinus]